MSEIRAGAWVLNLTDSRDHHPPQAAPWEPGTLGRQHLTTLNGGKETQEGQWILNLVLAHLGGGTLGALVGL